MKAIFYDRKNKREISSDKIMECNLIEHYLVIDEDGYGKNRWIDQEKQPGYVAERIVSELCYKSENCPSYHNWDMHMNTSDLIFLRFE